MRLYPYHSERLFARCPPLAGSALAGSMHAERLDGSGYHRSLKAESLGEGARVLAAAEVYQALLEARPHRQPLQPGDAIDVLKDEIRAGRLAGRAVEAVLEAAGAGAGADVPRLPLPGGLTEREVEVLRVIARGRSNKEVASQLGIAAKTVGNHVENIYQKVGISTRGAATLFAVKNGLVDTSPG